MLDNGKCTIAKHVACERTRDLHGMVLVESQHRAQEKSRNSPAAGQLKVHFIASCEKDIRLNTVMRALHGACMLMHDR